ncbi:TetR/AcrR family transcriptional regulator [Streptomyces luteoverticillatus]|uniref:TetR/AcrR family transcriptional regulator n=2 Tax=Streptomyces luteoverticillatus TaxID=66425 RepID=A0A3S9PR77_STRLT|nr:TetR/AcrR family transcriptional regulator [Streptomyces luteoverticillatus]
MLPGMSTAQPARKRDAAATREAILAAAVVEFTEHGYAGAGVRRIAERAGVTAMMVNRYFGSKQGLFTQAVARSFAPPTIVGDERADLAGAIAHTLTERTASDAERLDPFLLLLRSAPDPEAADIVRRGVEANVGARLAGLLDGPDADVRAQLALALVAGTWLLRGVVGTTALATADDARLIALLTDMLEPVVHEVGGTSAATGTGPDGTQG